MYAEAAQWYGDAADPVEDPEEFDEAAAFVDDLRVELDELFQWYDVELYDLVT